MTKYVVCVSRSYTANELAEIEIEAESEEEAKRIALAQAEVYPHLFDSDDFCEITYEINEVWKEK